MACRLSLFRLAFRTLPDRRGSDVDHSAEGNDCRSKQLIQSKMNEYRSRVKILERHLTLSKDGGAVAKNETVSSPSPSKDSLEVRHAATPDP